MNRIVIFLAIFLLVFAIIVGAVWFLGGKQENSTPESKVPAAELTKSSGDTNPGNVAIDVTLVTKKNLGDITFDMDPNQKAIAEWARENFNFEKNYYFFVQMNTHSVDISAFKMEEISSLTADGKKSKALKWESAMEGGGHHRNGFLVFQKTAEGKQLKLVIKGIPNIADRKFNWTL